MFENVFLYENNRVEDLYPFSIMHCSWELRTGAFMLFERYFSWFGQHKIKYIGREKHLNSFLKRFRFDNNYSSIQNSLFVDGSIQLNQKSINFIKKSIENTQKPVIFIIDSKVAAFFIGHNFNFVENFPISNVNSLLEKISNDSDKIELNDTKIINYLWDTLDLVVNQINEDIILKKYLNRFYQPQYHGVSAVNQSNIYLGEGVKIAPTVFLDASNGPIILDNNVQIMSQSSIIGPCYIGENTLVKIGAKIYPFNAIGRWCKVGGEIENTIIQSFSNKQHEGFLGHSYICEWVNLGADTNNSDLKNTYGNIKMRLPHKTIDSGRMFLGLMCGDHTKSAINTQFNTGTVAGIGAILFDSGFLSTTISSFCWGGAKNLKKYAFDDAIQTAKIVMSRRKKELTDEEILLMQQEYSKW